MACARGAGALARVTALHRRARLCTETYGGPQRARITGERGITADTAFHLVRPG